MPIPSVNFSVSDNGLQQQNPGLGNALVIIGCSSGGTVPVNTPVAATAGGTFIGAGGYGPGTQLAEGVAAATGNLVIWVQAATAVSGSNTGVSRLDPGGSTTVVTLTGSPNDSYYGLVIFTVAGTIGVADTKQFTLSLDGGRSIYQTVNLGAATTYPIPNTGITLNFAAGTMVVGDKRFWVSTEPQWSDSTMTSAITSLLGLPFGETFVDIVAVGGGGEVSQGSAGCTGGNVTNLDAQATKLFTQKRFCRVLCNTRDALWGGASTETENAWMTAIQSDHANDSTLRVGVTAGHYNVTSIIDQNQYRRPLLFLAAMRDSAIAIQLDLGEVDLGALAPLTIPTTVTWPSGVQGPNMPDGFLYHNEQAVQGLDAARFMSAMVIVGLPGFYITNPNLMAPPGSDFNWLDHGHVIDAACLLWYNYAVKRLSSGVRVNPATVAPPLVPGGIVNTDRLTIQNQGTQALRNVLTPGKVVTDVFVTIPGTDNILSTATLTTTVSVIPLGKIKTIATTVTFVNPAVQAVTASGQ